MIMDILFDRHCDSFVIIIDFSLKAQNKTPTLKKKFSQNKLFKHLTSLALVRLKIFDL